MTAIINFLFAAIKAGTPLLFGTTGEIVTQKAGNLNLGVEGMMYMGAFTGFYVGLTTGSLPLALLAAFGAGMLGALIYAFLTVTLKADQNVTGLTLTIFGTGFANFFGEVMISQTAGGQPKLPENLLGILAEHPIPLLSSIPFFGKLLFSHNLLVYLAVVVAVLCGFYISRTRAGLSMRSVGENPAAADAAGINVTLVKYTNILLGGGICGLGGVYISLINGGGVWNNGCVGGQGWTTTTTFPCPKSRRTRASPARACGIPSSGPRPSCSRWRSAWDWPSGSARCGTASRPSAPPPRTFRNTTTAMAIPGRLTSGPNGF